MATRRDRISIGIDPGKQGALAVAEVERVQVHDCPMFGTRSKPGDYNAVAMADLLAPYQHRSGVLVTVEQAQAMPKQGVSTTFQTGYGFGLWLGILAALRVPYQLVRPSIWKRAMLSGMNKRDKNVSRVAAIRMFPELADQLRLVGDHGRAEALLLAAYGSRSNGHGRQDDQSE